MISSSLHKNRTPKCSRWNLRKRYSARICNCNIPCLLQFKAEFKFFFTQNGISDWILLNFTYIFSFKFYSLAHNFFFLFSSVPKYQISESKLNMQEKGKKDQRIFHLKIVKADRVGVCVCAFVCIDRKVISKKSRNKKKKKTTHCTHVMMIAF